MNMNFCESCFRVGEGSCPCGGNLRRLAISFKKRNIKVLEGSLPGDHLTEEANRWLKLFRKLQLPVEFTFNGATLNVNGESTVDSILKQYDEYRRAEVARWKAEGLL